MKAENKYSICVIVCYFGDLPNYAKLFFDSCKSNPNIDFLLINDKIQHSYQDENIYFLKSSLEEFNQLASEKLQLPIALTWAFKICDFRSTFGKVYEDRLKGYDFWGYCDLDVVFGNTSHFLTNEALEKYDVFATNVKWMSGSFSLYRNNDIVNSLYTEAIGYQEVLTSSKYLGFDECHMRWDAVVYEEGNLPADKPYQSMFDVVQLAQRQGRIKAHFHGIIREWVEEIKLFKRTKDGFFDELKKEEFMYFHLLLVKRNWRFYIPQWKAFPETFWVTPVGLRKPHEMSGIGKIFWYIRRLRPCIAGISKSLLRRLTKK